MGEKKQAIDRIKLFQGIDSDQHKRRKGNKKTDGLSLTVKSFIRPQKEKNI